MLERDVELFMEHCELKGLSQKTIGNYEQTMRLFIGFSNEQGIVQTEKVTHMMVRSDINERPMRRILIKVFSKSCAHVHVDVFVVQN